MWPFTRNSHTIVTITIRPDHLVLAWITAERHSKMPVLRAYRSITLDQFTCAQGRVYNPSLLVRHIEHFIRTTRGPKPLVAMSVQGDYVLEKFLTCTTTQPSPEQLFASKAQLMMNYHYVCPSLHEGFIFYVCGMPREQWWQYQLFALYARINLIMLTTESMAHLTYYKKLYGAAFRQSQLSIDLERANYKLETYFTPDIIARSIRIDPTITLNLANASSTLATSIGLFFTGITQ